MRKLFIALAAMVFGWSSGASGVPIQWPAAAGGNDHYYEFIDNGSSISWTAAKAAAENRGGYLATLTSALEDNWVRTTLVIPDTPTVPPQAGLGSVVTKTLRPQAIRSLLVAGDG